VNAASFSIIAAVMAIYIAVLGVALIIVNAYIDERTWEVIAVFAGATLAIGAITVLLLVPRLRHLREATGVAEAIARGHFEARTGATNDEFAPLFSALNAAAANLDDVVSTLRLERAQLEALLNASSDATVAVDTSGIVRYLNDAARQMFEQSGAVETGRPFIEVVRDHDLNELMVSAARHGERSVRVVAYGQAQRWLQATAVPIDGAGTWAALAVFHDLTEVRRLDSMRRDFISNVSHELRTPLAGIRAAAETLQEGAIDDRPAAIEFMGHIQHETDRLTQMVEELLELSRIESGAAPLRFIQLDAAALVGAAVKRFRQQAERAGLTIALDAPEAPLSIIGDAERLERALGNLIANAIKFTSPGGEIIVRAQAEGDAVVISVHDTGIGIEPEQRARVFERFYKADKGRGDGTGLGLAIVKHIVRAHEGSVSVESFPGRGSTFTMRLPRR
jgi:two-component system phosphate regulon sensor histidine kinase PhoR